MKRVYTFLCVLILALSINAQGIEFEHVDWQDALTMAKEQDKLLFVDAYAQWCGPCKRMAKNEFTKSDVGDVYNSNFINLKLDMETPNGRTFDSQYPVSAYPTMFFLDGEGKVVKKVRGGKTGDQLISMAKEAIKSHDTSGKFASKYEEGDRSFETVYNYVEALNKVGKPSLKISNDFMRSNPNIDEGQKAKFLYAATVDCDSKIYEQMTAQKELVIKQVGEEAYNQKVRTACKKTIDKSIEFEFESLYDEALKKGKSHLTSGQKEFEAESKMYYSKEMKLRDQYIESLNSLSKIYLKKDQEKMQRLVGSLQNEYAKKEEMHDLIAEMSKKLFKKQKSGENAILHAKSLILKQDFKEAEKVVEKGMKIAEENKSLLTQLGQLKKVIERKKA